MPVTLAPQALENPVTEVRGDDTDAFLRTSGLSPPYGGLLAQ